MCALRFAPHEAPATTRPEARPEAATRQPRSTVRRYERQEHTGSDAYRASLLAERLTAPTTTDIGPWDGYGAGWPWDITRCAAMLSQRGIRAALGEDIARRLDWLMTGDQRRAVKARSAQRLRWRAERRAHVAAMGGMPTSGERTYLRSWPEAWSTHRGSGTTSQQRTRGYRAADDAVMSADEAETALRPLLLGEWRRVRASYCPGYMSPPPCGGWVRGYSHPIPAGILLQHYDGWEMFGLPQGSRGHRAILVPMDQDAREQLANLRQLADLGERPYISRRPPHPPRLEVMQIACPILT